MIIGLLIKAVYFWYAWNIIMAIFPIRHLGTILGQNIAEMYNVTKSIKFL